MKKLYRSRHDRRICGVCGGLANYLSVDSTLIRVIAVISLCLSGMGFFVYMVMAVIVPLENPTNVNA